MQIAYMKINTACVSWNTHWGSCRRQHPLWHKLPSTPDQNWHSRPLYLVRQWQYHMLTGQLLLGSHSVPIINIIIIICITCRLIEYIHVTYFRPSTFILKGHNKSVSGLNVFCVVQDWEQKNKVRPVQWMEFPVSLL